MSAWDGMSFDDDDETSREVEQTLREDATTRQAEKSELQALRDEVAQLRAQVSDVLDPAEVVAVNDRRRAIQETAEREANAAAAAQDPRTLEQLRDIEDEETLIRFMKDRGYGKGLVG